MLSESNQAVRVALISCSLIFAPAALAQTWVDPPSNPHPRQALSEVPGGEAAPGSDTVTKSVQATVRRDKGPGKARTARDLAYAYLDLWSAPNRVSLASAPSFYAPTVRFHGRTWDMNALLAEKRRMAKRWPDRNYRYRPETTQVACEADGVRCSVWSIFDFSAADPDHSRRSRGLGEHEIVVSFAGAKPVIISESSRVLFRGAARSR
jgi:hypothetical protein